MFTKVVKNCVREEFLIFTEEARWREFVNSRESIEDKAEVYRDADHTEVWVIAEFIANFNVPTNGNSVNTQDDLITVSDHTNYISVRLAKPTLIELLTED
jgi:hypothetical protein